MKTGCQKGRFYAALFAASAIVGLAACGGPEEREAEHRRHGKALFEQGDHVKATLEFRSALQIKPANVESLYYLARIAEAREDYVGARQGYERAIQQNDRFLPALVGLGELVLAAGDRVKAAELAGRALEIDGNSSGARALNAALLWQQNMPVLAEGEAKSALALDPSHPRALSILATIEARRSRVEEAVALLDDGLRRLPRETGLRLVKIQILSEAGRESEVDAAYRDLIAVAPARHAYKLAWARRLVDQQRLDEAEALLRDSVAATPDDRPLRDILIAFLVEKRDWRLAEQQLLQFAALAPRDASYRLRLADLYARNGLLPQARATLQQIIDRDRNSVDATSARPQLARLALAENRPEEAAGLVASTLAADPANAEALLVRATLAAARHDRLSAIADLRTILRSQPNAVPALALLAQLYAAGGEPLLALDTYRSLVTAAPSNVVARVTFAERLRENGQRDRALSEIDTALKQAPDFVPALKGKAILMIDQGMLTLAEAIGGRLFELPEGRTAAAVVMGASAFQRRDYDGAIDHFSRAAEGSPRAEEALGLLVVAYNAAGRREAAADYLAARLERDPNDLGALMLLADQSILLGRTEQAETVLRRAVALPAATPAAYLKLGDLLARTDRLPQSLGVIENGLSRMPDAIALRLDAAMKQEAVQDYVGARRSYEAVLAINPRHQLAANNLAVLITEVWAADPDLLAQARRLAEPFRHGNDPALLDTLGWVQFRIGNHADAVQLLEKAVALAPDRAEIRYHLGQAYAALGDEQRAQAELRRAGGHGTPRGPGDQNLPQQPR